MIYVVTWYIGDSPIPHRKYYQRFYYAERWKTLMEKKGYLAYIFEISLDKYLKL